MEESPVFWELVAELGDPFAIFHPPSNRHVLEDSQETGQLVAAAEEWYAQRDWGCAG